MSNSVTGTGGGVYKSTDNGLTWSLTNLDKAIGVMSASGSTIYAGSFAYGMFVSNDDGSSWTLSQSGLAPYCTTIHGNDAFIGTGAGVYVSTNSGGGWVKTSFPNYQVNSLASNGSNLFAATQGYGVYVSTNSGTTWKQINSSSWVSTALYAYSLGVIGQNIILGNGALAASVWMTANNGTTWTDISNGIPTYAGNTVLNFSISATHIYGGVQNSGSSANSAWKRAISDLGITTEIIVESESNSLNIYPNPSNGRLSIESTGSITNLEVSVFNLAGEKILTQNSSDINLANAPKGVYFVKISNGEKIVTKKIVLQ